MKKIIPILILLVLLSTLVLFGCNDNSCAGHSFGTWSVVEDATCQKEGTRSHTCTVCGTTETEKIDIAGHSYKDGVCEFCDIACSHENFGSWTVIENATCESEGVRSHTCTTCNTAVTEAIDTLPHDYEDGVCSDCETVCQHSWDEWNNEHQAVSCTDDGLKARSCTICQLMETSVIAPATGHSLTNWTYTATSATGECSVCQATEERALSNITAEALGNSKPVCSGNSWASSNVVNIVNGDWDDKWTSTLQANNSALVVDLYFAKTTYVDVLFFKTISGSTSINFSVEVKKAGENDWTTITDKFVSGILNQIELGYEINALRVSERMISNGLVGWQEIGIFTINENE